MNKIITQIGLLIFCCALIVFSRVTLSFEQVLIRAATIAISIVLVLSVLVLFFFKIVNKTSIEKSKLLQRKQSD